MQMRDSLAPQQLSCAGSEAARPLAPRRHADVGDRVARVAAAARTRKTYISRVRRARQRDVASGAHPPQKCASGALLTTIAAILFCASAV